MPLEAKPKPQTPKKATKPSPASFFIGASHIIGALSRAFCWVFAVFFVSRKRKAVGAAAEGEPSTTPEWRLEQKPEGRKGGRLEGERDGPSEGFNRSDFLNVEAHQRGARRPEQQPPQKPGRKRIRTPAKNHPNTRRSHGRCTMETRHISQPTNIRRKWDHGNDNRPETPASVMRDALSSGLEDTRRGARNLDQRGAWRGAGARRKASGRNRTQWQHRPCSDTLLIY